MSTKWDETSWQKDFLNMKSHSPADAKLLMGGVKGLKNVGVKVFCTVNTKEKTNSTRSIVLCS